VKGAEPVGAGQPARQNEGGRIQLLDNRRAVDQGASAQLRALKDCCGDPVTAMPERSKPLRLRLARSRLRQFDRWHLAYDTEPGGSSLDRHRQVAKAVETVMLGMEEVAYLPG
jgi:hypothetical protein